MRLRVLVVSLLLAACVVPIALRATPSAAFTPPPETGWALVSNQNAGCYNDQVVIAKPLDNGAFVRNLGKPGAINGRLNEAKPFDRNTKVVALWGQQPLSTGYDGGVGIYDLRSNQWTSWFPLPADWGAGSEGSGLAHSVTVLDDANPDTDDDIAVAQTGTIGTSGQWGWVVVFRRTGQGTAEMKDKEPLLGVHGVEWDRARTELFGIGDNGIKRFAYTRGDGKIATIETWDLTDAGGTNGGHDLRRRRASGTGVVGEFFITTNSQTYTFDPKIPATSTTSKAIKVFPSSGGLGGGIKSMDERFDGVVEYSNGNGNFNFVGSNPKAPTGFCMKEYKVRWLYDLDKPVWRDDADQNTTPAQPFLWEHHVVTGGTPIVQSNQLWVGRGAAPTDDTPAKAASKVTAAYNEGKVPFIKFYHWGDSGQPTMANVLSATPTQWDSWDQYASAIADAIGDRQATVVIEPEWDVNPNAPCNATYRTHLRSVLRKFETLAENALVINGVGFWDRGVGSWDATTGTNKLSTKYHCMTDSLDSEGPLAPLFDAHGMILHLVSKDPACTLRHETHPDHDTQPYYGAGFTYTSADSFMQNVGPNELSRLKSIFKSQTAYITDLLVTRCGWGTTGQTNLYTTLVNQLTTLYSTHGLRGVAFRDDHQKADPSEMYLGYRNENEADYWLNPSALQLIETGRQQMHDYLASIGGAAPDPEFVMSASGPATVTAGGSATFRVSVQNTKGSLTNGGVTFEIYDPNGAQKGHKPWSGVNIPNGGRWEQEYTWTAPATPTGSYRLKIGVFDSAWQQLEWNDNAGSITVGGTEPSFTATASASPATLAPDATTTVTANVTNTGAALSNATVSIQVFRPSGAINNEKPFAGQSFTAGQTKPYQMTWTAPSTAGTYKIGVVVTGADSTPTYYSRQDLGTITVTSSKFTSATTVSRSTVTPGGTTTVSTTITNTGTTALVNGIVDIEFYDPAGDKTRVFWEGVSLAVGEQRVFSTPWTAPASPTGTYAVKVGVFTTGWAQTLHWEGNAAAITVAQLEFALVASAPAKVMPGGPVPIQVDVTATGATIDNVIVDVEVYDPAGQRVPGAQMFWSGQTLTHDVTSSYSWNWTAPATLATYTVKVGVFPANWGPRHAWNDNADKVVVAWPSHTMTADVSASTVAPGGTVTITAAYTNNGGSMTNGIVDLEVYGPAGGPPVPQHYWTGQSIDSGYAKTYSYTWTAPATPGTYTVKLGVFSSDWSKQWGWNNGAATISVGSTFQPSFRVGSGANTWWFEVYTSSDVTSVDVIADSGRIYMNLPKKPWGAFAGQPPSQVPAGQPVQFIARRSSDGATGASSSFAWLNASPTTQPGWAGNVVRGANSSTTWVEATAASTATGVDVKVGTGSFTALTYSATSGKWGRAMSVPAGSDVVFRARRADGAYAYSTFLYNWPNP